MLERRIYFQGKKKKKLCWFICSFLLPLLSVLFFFLLILPQFCSFLVFIFSYYERDMLPQHIKYHLLKPELP